MSKETRRQSSGESPSQGVAVAQQPVKGWLKIKLNRGRNLKGPELLSKKDCYVVFTYDRQRQESEVKGNTTAPVWDQEFVFDDVPYPPPGKLAITVVYKSEKGRDEVLGVAQPALSLWTIDQAPPQNSWIPISTRESMYGGELNLSLHWRRVERKYREPFKLLQAAVRKTQPFSDILAGPIDTVIEGIKNIIKKGNAWLKGLATPYAVALGLALSLLLVGLSLTVAIPALIMFPITGLLLLGGFLTFVALSIFLGPVTLGVSWLIVCSGPVQNKVIEPLLEKLLKHERVRKLLTVD